MNDFLQFWSKSAEQLGLDEVTRKGLLFIIALDSSVVKEGRGEAESFARIRRISPHFPVPDGMGGRFYDGKIEGILTELTYALNPGFSPRVVFKSQNGADLRAFNLPETSYFAEFDFQDEGIGFSERIHDKLLRLVGEQIDEDLEGAYLAGLLFFSSYANIDTTGTITMVRAALHALPPHLQLLTGYFLSAPIADLKKYSLMDMILAPFLGPSDGHTQDFFNAVYGVNRFLQDKAQSAIWNLGLSQFYRSVSLIPFRVFDEKHVPQWIDAERSKLAGYGFEAPQLAESQHEAFSAIRDTVAARWGLELDSTATLTRGQEYNRRACVILICVVFAVLLPGWNWRARVE